MGKADSIRIRSDKHREMSTNIVVNGKKYMILTEDVEPRENTVCTKVYLGGKIVLTDNIDCTSVPKGAASPEKILALVRSQHKRIAGTLREEESKKTRKPSDYLDEVKTLLQRKRHKQALELLTQALEEYPSEPFLLSYLGCLEAIINKKYSYGIDICLEAIRLLDHRMSFGQEIFYPTFYLNLGRAYIAAKKRRDAAAAFHKGLTYDKENRDLIWEMNKLGRRRTPALSGLSRSNPLNKYIGLVLYRLHKISS